MGQTKDKAKSKEQGVFCRIRIYNRLKSGFSIKERKTQYIPFKLSVCFGKFKFKNERGEDQVQMLNPKKMLLFLMAIPLRSVYCGPEEDMSAKSTIVYAFTTVHNAACTFSDTEETAISYLGYLPQDIDGEEIFKFIHPQDLSLLTEDFKTAMLEQGKPCKGKSIRFLVQNGGYIMVHSWWSCHINLWSKKLEFVRGKHYVTKGPKNPNVFADFVRDSDQSFQMDNEQIDAIRNNIWQTLQKPVQWNMIETNKLNSSKIKKELESCVGSLLKEDETKKCVRPENKKSSQYECYSPETIPSYTQLLYNENLITFFNSQSKIKPEKDYLCKILEESDMSHNLEETKYKKKHSDKLSWQSAQNKDEDRFTMGSGGFGKQGQTNTSLSEGPDSDTFSTLQAGLSTSPVQSGQDNGMISQEGSGRGSRLCPGSTRTKENQPTLTEELLSSHNKHMEWQMLLKYKEDRKT